MGFLFLNLESCDNHANITLVAVYGYRILSLSFFDITMMYGTNHGRAFFYAWTMKGLTIKRTKGRLTFLGLCEIQFSLSPSLNFFFTLGP